MNVKLITTAEYFLGFLIRISSFVFFDFVSFISQVYALIIERRCKMEAIINKVAEVLVIIGALNWGLAIFDINLVTYVMKYMHSLSVGYMIQEISLLHTIFQVDLLENLME